MKFNVESIIKKNYTVYADSAAEAEQLVAYMCKPSLDAGATIEFDTDNETIISEKDKIAALNTIRRLVEPRLHFDFDGPYNHTFCIYAKGGEYWQYYETMRDFLVDGFNGAKINTDEIKILADSEWFMEVLACITLRWYKKNKNAILSHENDISYGKEYLIDKLIATKIIESQPSYKMVETYGMIFIGYDYNSEEHFINIIHASGRKRWSDIATSWHESYSSVLFEEAVQVDQDIRDIGLYDEDDKWDFYLTKDELNYLKKYGLKEAE